MLAVDTIEKRRTENGMSRNATIEINDSVCFVLMNHLWPRDSEQDQIINQAHRRKKGNRVGESGKDHHPIVSNFSSTFFAFQALAVYLRRKEQPSVRRALPPVGWQRTVEQPAQITTVWACEKTVVIVKQPGHLTSMKKERGAGTRVLSLCLRASD